MPFPRDVPVLSDDVVTLRGHQLADVDGVLEQCQDPVSRQWTTVPQPYTLADAKRFVTQAMPGGWADDVEWGFAVEATDDAGVHRFAGTVSLRNAGEHRAEVAYGAHPWARGRGVMERALRLLLFWGFAERDLRTVIWWANRGNWASRRLAWQLGFTFEGAPRQWLPQRGELRDAWVGTLLAGEPLQPRTTWLDVPRIAGRSVALRGLRYSDVPRIVEGCADAETQHWLGQLPQPYHPVDAESFLEDRTEQRARGSAVAWAITLPAEDELLGIVELFGIRLGTDAEIGFWVHPKARRQGLGLEACRLALRHAFVPTRDGGLGLRRVRAVAAEQNEASRHLLRAAGLHEQGRERRLLRVREGMADGVIYDLLHSEL